MIRIDAKKDDIQGAKKTNFARCPVCNQILFDVEYAHGIMTVRQMCRRCRSYVEVDIVGN